MPRFEMGDLLDLVLEEGASDLHIPCYSPPVLRMHGEMTPLDTEPLGPEDTEYLMKSITSEANQQKLQQDGGVDFGFAFGDKARFRVSVFKAKGNIGMVLRTIPNGLLSMEQIGLPPSTKDILFKPRGLVLVTGPTGSGKSTTLASMIDVINRERSDHIITIEDPIEFYHGHKRSVVTQREVHNDVPSFAEAIRRALRQDPDIILVGEMRDLETMALALTCATMGMLVFATLHTNNAPKTVDRIIDTFPAEQQPQIRAMLAQSLSAVVSQLLCRTKDGKGRIGSFEILLKHDGLPATIREGQIANIRSIIEQSSGRGMRTMDNDLMRLLKEDVISPMEAYMKSTNKLDFEPLLGDADRQSLRNAEA